MDSRKSIIERRRKCPICKSPVIGRSDKRFCSTKCKTYYGWKLRKVTKLATLEIDKILHRNRSILLEVMGKNSKSKKIPRIELERRNFKFMYHTHTIVNSKGKTFCYIYDFAWMTFSDDEVLIIRKK